MAQGYGSGLRQQLHGRGGSGSAVSSARPGLLDERMGAPPAHRRFESQAVIESARRVGGEQQQSHPQRRGAEHCHRQHW